jgi:hypothetical protein
LGIPITIEQNNNVGCDQIDTKTTSSGGEEENKLLTIRRIVVVNSGDSGFVIGPTIDSAVLSIISSNH